MSSGKCLIELANHISARNVNFYLDAYEAMCAVNEEELQHADDALLPGMLDLIVERRLEKNPQEAIETLLFEYRANGSVQSVGRLIASNLRLGKFNEKTGVRTELPFIFLNYSIVEDLLLRGHGPWYALVEKVTWELGSQEGVKSGKQYGRIPGSYSGIYSSGYGRNIFRLFVSQQGLFSNARSISCQ